MASTAELLDKLNESVPLTGAIDQPPVSSLAAPAVSTETASLLERLNQSVPPPPDLKPDFPGAAFIEPVTAIATEAATMVGGGLAGLVASFVEDPETGARIVESFQRQNQPPETEAGQRSMQAIGDVVKTIADKFNVKVSEISLVADFFLGTDPKTTVDTIMKIRESGSGVAAGDRVLKATNNPVLATLARIGPEAIGEILLSKGVLGAVGKFGKPDADMVRIREALETQSGNVEAVGFKLEEPKALSGFETEAQRIAADPGAPKTRLQEGLLGFDAGAPKAKVIKDLDELEAVAGGFDEGVLGGIKDASQADIRRMLEMVDIMEQGKRNKKFSIENRPADVAGDSVLKRYKAVARVRKDAGVELGRIARKDLKGKEIDVSAPTNTFLDELEEAGVVFLDRQGGRFGLTSKKAFRNSDFNLVPSAKKIIRDVVDALSGADVPDARSVHRMKQQLSELLDFGKKSTERPLTGKAKNIIKNLRRGLNERLRVEFPEYGKVNDTLSETIDAMNELESGIGKKLDLNRLSADKAVGQELRKLMGNRQVRIPLNDALREIERLAIKHSPDPKAFTDDVSTLALFADELDSVFGTAARTSFSGKIGQAVRGPTSESPRGVIRNVVIKASEKAKTKLLGTDRERSFAAIRRLLKNRLKKKPPGREVRRAE